MDYRKEGDRYIISAPKAPIVARLIDDQSLQIKLNPRARPSILKRLTETAVSSGPNLSSTGSASQQGRTFTSTDGQTMVASILFIQGENVILQKDGKNVTVPVSRFTPGDQNYIDNWQKKNAGKPPAHLKDNSQNDDSGIDR